jgi:hypothetical protein
MIPQERDLISDLFNRLRAADTAAKDPEAEALIRSLTANHPGAPYLLVQTTLVQEQALTGAQARIEELQRQLTQVQAQLQAAQAQAAQAAQAQAAQAAPRPAGSGSFLGGGAGLLGAFGRRPTAAEPPPPPPPGPWGAAPPPQPGPWGAPAPQPGGPWGGAPQPGPWAAPRSGGFLQSAMTTAAGVAGGALLFEGIEHLMGGGSALAQTASTPLPSTPTEVIENTTVNNYYGDQNSNSQLADTGTNYDDGTYYDDV